MITNSKQVWKVGAAVKVGFMADLIVVAAVPTPGDHAPDAYVLSRKSQFYSFVPHNGLSKIDLLTAREMVADAHVQDERRAADALAYSQKCLAHIADINDLIFPEYAARRQALAA